MVEGKGKSVSRRANGLDATELIKTKMCTELGSTETNIVTEISCGCKRLNGVDWVVREIGRASVIILLRSLISLKYSSVIISQCDLNTYVIVLYDFYVFLYVCKIYYVLSGYY